MIFADTLDELKIPPGAASVLTIGCFDGLHVGHKRIVERIDTAAGEFGALRGLLTFDPHPDLVVKKISGRYLIDTRAEKEKILAEMSLDFVVFFNFTPEFAAIPAGDFIDMLTARFGVRRIVVGSDTRFGFKGAGTVALLEEEGGKRGFDVDVVRKVVVHGEPVSSTRIREILGEGDVELAETLLGRPFRITGPVVHGDGRSRTDGFPPTVNIGVEREKLLPTDGVYAVTVEWAGRKENAVANIGLRPTVGGRARQVEAHIMGFSGDLYGADAAMEFVKYIRPEERFPDIETLKEKIQEDIRVAGKIFAGR